MKWVIGTLLFSGYVFAVAAIGFNDWVSSDQLGAMAAIHLALGGVIWLIESDL